MDELRTVMKLLLCPKQCIHQYFENYFDHNEYNNESHLQESDACKTKCWFCLPTCQTHHPIKSADKNGTIKTLRSIFCDRNKHPMILASKLPKMIIDHIKKHDQKDSIWPSLSVSKVPNSHAHTLVLALIAVNVLTPKLKKIKPADEYEEVILTVVKNAEGKQLWETDQPWEELIG